MHVSYLYSIIGNEAVSLGGFADDQQLYLNFKPNIKSIHLAINNIEHIISKVRNFFLTYNLSINDKKIELIIYKKLLIYISISVLWLFNHQTVRNLGIIFDKNLLNGETNWGGLQEILL